MKIILLLISFFTIQSALAFKAVPNEYVIKSPKGLQQLAMAKLEAYSYLKVVRKIDEQTSLVNSSQDLQQLIKAGYLVEPNYYYHALEESSETWNLENLGQANCSGQIGIAGFDVAARQAQEITTGQSNVVVAVIDTGVDFSHPALQGKGTKNLAELGGKPLVDDDENGLVDDVDGYNFYSNTIDPTDDHGHGTHVSGIIAAKDYGVAPGVSLLPVKFLGAWGDGTLADAILAINYAVSRGARILSNSWGGGPFSQALYEAIQAAAQKDILFVAAAGNEYGDNDIYPTYPATYDLPNVLSVTAINNQGLKPPYANTGLTTVDVAAPGDDIMSTTLGKKTECMSGTSMAAPHVSAIAALLLSLNPRMTATELKDRILKTATPAESMRGKTVSGGIVSAFSALNGDPLK